jgi:hypothetical protein
MGWNGESNYALRTPDLTKLVFDLVDYAATHITHGTVKDVIGIKHIQSDTQLAINGNEKTVARKVLERAGLPAKLMMRVDQHRDLCPMDVAWGLA